MPKPVNISTYLTHHPLFCEMSPECIERIVRGARTLNLEQADVLFHRGDLSSGFYVVIYGEISLAFTSPHGGERVLEIFGPGQSFGYAEMFMGMSHSVYAQALTNSVVLHVSMNAISGGIDSDPAFSRKLLADISTCFLRVIRIVESLLIRSSAQRVVDYLLKGIKNTKEGQNIHIGLTAYKNVIASSLNISPETFSRILRDLSDAGLITVNGKDICIRDVAKLRMFDEINGQVIDAMAC